MIQTWQFNFVITSILFEMPFAITFSTIMSHAVPVAGMIL